MKQTEEELSKKNIIRNIIQFHKQLRKTLDNLYLSGKLYEEKLEYEISTEEDIEKVISKLTDEMITYAKELNFEKAAEIRDKIKELEKILEKQLKYL